MHCVMHACHRVHGLVLQTCMGSKARSHGYHASVHRVHARVFKDEAGRQAQQLASITPLPPFAIYLMVMAGGSK